MRKQLTLTLAAAACALLAGCSSSNESKKAEEKQAPPAAAAPETPKPAETPAPAPAVEPAKPAAPAKPAEPAKPEPRKAASNALPDKAPDVYKVRMDTSKGLVMMECHKAWSPRGADHFYDLVKIHFFDGVRFFRVISGFMAQFGINGTPATDRVWADANILDDPPAGQHNTRGMVTYGRTSMPNSRSTQMFINFGNNSRLDGIGFTPVCQVTSGMENVDQIWAGYGELPDQQMMHAEGNAYLTAQFPHLDYIKTAAIVLQ
jgi:peptidyl-prolyl cis-trans isomerase A (cyclophilin A)